MFWSKRIVSLSSVVLYLSALVLLRHLWENREPAEIVVGTTAGTIAHLKILRGPAF